MADTPQPDRTPYCHKIRYGITGAPIITADEMDGSHAPGVGVRPTRIELVYSPTRDGQPARVDASVTGDWTRFGEPDEFGGQMTTHFKSGPDGWPAWLAQEARLHAPAAILPPPADQAALERVRAVLETEAVVGRSALEYRGLIASALMADEAPEPETGDDLIEEYLRFLRGQGAEPDLSGLPEEQRQAVTGQLQIVKALADRDPELPPLDRDPVARRLGLHTPAAETPEPPAQAEAPVCEGFRWIGQPFTTCDRCGQPAWDHVGEDVPVEGAGPFDNRRTVRPWGPGEADRIRARWASPAAAPAVGQTDEEAIRG